MPGKNGKTTGFNPSPGDFDGTGTGTDDGNIEGDFEAAGTDDGNIKGDAEAEETMPGTHQPTVAPPPGIVTSQAMAPLGATLCPLPQSPGVLVGAEPLVDE